MDIRWSTYRIHTVHPFGISRSTHSHYDIIFIYLIDGDIIGRGEAAPNIRYQETPEKVLSQLEMGIPLSKSHDGVDDLMADLKTQTGGLHSLEAAFSMAALDWWTQKKNISVSDYFGNELRHPKPTSFTIAIGDLNSVKEKIAESEPYSILKVKLGTADDKAIIREIRKHTRKIIRVDANEGWDLNTALEMTSWLHEQNVELVEQPLKEDQLEESAILKKNSPIQIIADESVTNSSDIPKIANAFHGINIKLMKCGSMFEAYKMIETAKEHQLKIMLGCMVETSIGITAASHLSSFADYVDLDGNLLIQNDPYIGTEALQGKLVLPNRLGLGVKLGIANNKLL